MRKVVSLVVAFVMMLGLLCSCASAQQFTKDGLTITLRSTFQDESASPYAEDMSFLYTSRSCAVMGVKDDRAQLEALLGELTLEEYGSLIIELNELGGTMSQREGLWTFTYTATVDNVDYTYLSAVYETDANFWTVQVYCASDDYAKLADTMFGYLKTVTLV